MEAQGTAFKSPHINQLSQSPEGMSYLTFGLFQSWKPAGNINSIKKCVNVMRTSFFFLAQKKCDSRNSV